MYKVIIEILSNYNTADDNRTTHRWKLMTLIVSSTRTWWCLDNVIDTKNHFCSFCSSQNNTLFHFERFSDAQLHHVSDCTTVHIQTKGGITSRVSSTELRHQLS